MRSIITFSVITLIAAVTLSGCGKNERAWKDAQKHNTVEAYLAFKRSYPESAHVAMADKSIRLLRRVKKDKLFNNLNVSLLPFLNNETPSIIVEVCGKNSKNVAFDTAGEDVRWSILSGKFTILGGAMVPISGSKVVVSIYSDSCKVVASIGSPGKVSKVEKVTFKNGTKIKFLGGEQYIFNGTTWGEIH